MEGRPTAKNMGVNEEFVYAVRIVNLIMKVDMNKDCERNDVIRAIEKTFKEYKEKIMNGHIEQTK